MRDRRLAGQESLVMALADIPSWDVGSRWHLSVPTRYARVNAWVISRDTEAAHANSSLRNR
jgi:hypothetical protein